MIDEKLSEVIRTRRSIRSFDQNRKVPKKILNEVLEAANWAPSACNGQAWHFIVIDNNELLSKLVKNGLQKAKDAPVVILVYYRKYIKLKPVNNELADHIQSASAAIQNILLTVHNLGLGACWLNGLDLSAVKKAVPKTAGYEFIAMLKVGYPQKAIKEYTRQPRKYAVDEIISYNNFDLPKKDLAAPFSVFLERNIAKIKRLIIIKFFLRLVPKNVKKRFAPVKDIDSFKKN